MNMTRRAIAMLGCAALALGALLVAGCSVRQYTVNRLGELMGRPKAEIRGALKGLDRYCWLIVGRDPRAPLIVTKPDEIKPKRANS